MRPGIPLLVGALILAGGFAAGAYLGGNLPLTDPDPHDEPRDGNATVPPRPETVWETPTWHVGDRWTYRVWTPNGTGTASIEVVDDEATVAGEPVYTVHRSLDNQTVHYHRETLNRVREDGSQERVYEWPLRDGASWNITSEAFGDGEVRAEHVRDVVASVGVVEAYQITEVFEDQDAVEVVYYSERYRNYARIDNYEDGRRTLTLSLVEHQAGG